MEKDLLNHEDLAGDRGMIDDLFDETYREKEGPKPPLRYVWRNIILMSLLHLGALFALTLIPSAKIQTLAWGKHVPLSVSWHLQSPDLLGGIFFFQAHRLGDETERSRGLLLEAALQPDSQQAVECLL